MMRSSTFLRRFGAVLSMVFLLDLGGQASTTLCALSGATAQNAVSAAAGGMNRTVATHSAQNQAAPARDHCRVPTTAMDCAAMTTCASFTALVTMPLAALAVATPWLQPAEPALPSFGRAVAPEPPPPRD